MSRDWERQRPKWVAAFWILVCSAVALELAAIVLKALA